MDTMISETMERWIEEHLNDNPADLRLKYGGKSDGFDYATAIMQIECRRKFGKKLSQTLAAFPRFYFPSALAGEQSTADIVAEYHQSLVPEGLACVDLTCGLGIDALHMASRAASVVAIDRNPALVEALRYNAEGLSVASVIEPVQGDCVEFIDSCIASGRRFDMAFIDPARRAADGSRLFALADCEPDVVSLLPRLSQICRMLVIKASPMLDINHTVESLSPSPVSVAAVGTPTECKELLITVDFTGAEERTTMIEAVTLRPEGSEIFAFTREREAQAPMPAAARRIAEGDVVYEPSPCMMKAGAFKLLAQQYRLNIFHPNTRLFYGGPDDVAAGFPGSRWRVLKVLPYASRVIKRFKSEYPAISIAARNFGISAESLRSRLGVREAPGDLRLFAVGTWGDERLLIVCERF